MLIVLSRWCYPEYIPECFQCAGVSLIKFKEQLVHGMCCKIITLLVLIAPQCLIIGGSETWTIYIEMKTMNIQISVVSY